MTAHLRQGSGGQEISIALVDDHRVVTAGLRRFLESFPGVRVVGVADNGEQLLEMLPAWTPDIVVVDLLMPGGIDGVETTRRALEICPTTRIIALTASVDEARMEAVLRAGARGYVRKDADPELLLKGIRAVARGGTFVDAGAARPRASAGLVGDLSPREIDVLRQVAFGRTNRDAAATLFISEETVKTHVARILDKLSLENRAQLVAYAVKHGLVGMDEL
jgi:DNA-binding NarL/FixJ family response regulator